MNDSAANDYPAWLGTVCLASAIAAMTAGMAHAAVPGKRGFA
jgi:hypothetical protein